MSATGSARLIPRRLVEHAPQFAARAHFDFRIPYHTFSRHQTLNSLAWTPLSRVKSVTCQSRRVSHEQTAKDLNQQGVDEALSDFDAALAEDTEKQHRAPWHRQGVEEPPVRRQRSAGAMTKGRAGGGLYHSPR
jgi:hypothetical protein